MKSVDQSADTTEQASSDRISELIAAFESNSDGDQLIELSESAAEVASDAVRDLEISVRQQTKTREVHGGN